MVGLVKRGTALSPALLSSWPEHLTDEGDAEAAFQLALFNVCTTPRNLLKAEWLLCHLHTFGHPKTALKLGLLLHTIQDGPDGEHRFEFFPEASASCGSDGVNN